MNEALEPAVADALAHFGLRGSSFSRISSIRSPEIDRCAYRIELDPSRTIKARHLENDETARRQYEIRRELPDAFAPAFARHGAVLLEEWVEGDGLGDGVPGDGLLAEAGSLLGDLHARATLTGQALHGRHSTAADRALATESLRQAAGAGALDEPDATLLREAMERLDPGQAIHGLVHFDFCGENMVLDRAGRLRVVDNERIGVNALGLDLARTWYRWALPPAAWERFRSAYAAGRPFAEPLDTLGFWAIVAVARSAALRLRAHDARADVPLLRLRRMASELGRPRAMPDAEPSPSRTR